MTEARAGMLLVATPTLLVPNFTDTVVCCSTSMTTAHWASVLNRPTAVPVTED